MLCQPRLTAVTKLQYSSCYITHVLNVTLHVCVLVFKGRAARRELINQMIRLLRLDVAGYAAAVDGFGSTNWF